MQQPASQAAASAARREQQRSVSNQQQPCGYCSSVKPSRITQCNQNKERSTPKRRSRAAEFAEKPCIMTGNLPSRVVYRYRSVTSLSQFLFLNGCFCSISDDPSYFFKGFQCHAILRRMTALSSHRRTEVVVTTVCIP
ncbi:hypothetical protein Y032_0010g850 [Ancylostoma ceylanicum]|uniref:Uncharacterized protein n=1 Tax=Ancylostoma ceylanicum TaxID=53326 RepID=A0A016VG65_9BILA|nr:hypothetical protein Y032_0010g850 [Ancylostoma ceylanicum]